ncbi:MAG TPA: lipopolysaccharide heptosyltransferase II [Pyrinomonadaceae bacterium]|nr:lipopolysaccharide heptosyltransferase II [Pyrinomonadaceae bacterium]
MADIKKDNIRRIVVRGTNWVGDAVMTVPALRALRRAFPDAHITLATRGWAQGLFADADFVDDIQVHEGTGLRSVVSQVRAWQKHGFDLAVLFPNSLESALVAALSRVPIRTGYATEGRQRLLTHPLQLPEWRSSRHEIYYYLNIVEQLDGSENQVTSPDGLLTVSAASKAEARSLLESHGVSAERRLIALCPGSINSRAKRWPAERYAALGDRMISELDADVVLIGSEAELEVTSQVTKAMKRQPIVLTSKTNLTQLAGVLSLVDLLVTNDTGPAHIASALGRPTLVIFGPTNPLTTRPYSESGQIMRVPPECAPCMLRDCPIDHRCMTAITPDDVFQQSSLMLAAQTSETRADRVMLA